jgi:cell division protease FtsH
VRTKALLIERKVEVEKLAKELLHKEVLFQSDVEALIGKRPYGEKKPADLIHDIHPNSQAAEAATNNGTPSAEVINEPETENN